MGKGKFGQVLQAPGRKRDLAHQNDAPGENHEIGGARTLDLGSILVWPMSACSPSRAFTVRGKGGQNRIAYRS
jgi:hypothetical protein